MRKPYKSVENYTNAFLVTVGLVLFMAFFTLAATKGFVWVVLSAALIDGLIRLRAARLRTSSAG
jgi:hypothetical protein